MQDLANKGDPLDLAVVVLSCDRYSDLWKPCLNLLLSAWESVPHPTYLCANKQKYSDSRVMTLLSGDDPDWSTSISRSLSQIKHEYVLLLFDDTFFCEPVDPQRLQMIKSFIIKVRPSYLRFRPSPFPDEPYFGPFGRIDEATLYRTSTLGFWHRETLLSLLRPGESAWQFEYNSPARATELPLFFGVYEKFFSYIHGVEKGLWIPPALAELQKITSDIDLARRPVMTNEAYRSYKLAMLRETIFDRVPAKVRPLLLAAKRTIFGSRNP